MKETFEEKEMESLRHRFDAYMRACINTVVRDEIKKETNYRRAFYVNSEIAESEHSCYEDGSLLEAEDEEFILGRERIRIRNERLADALHVMRRLRRDIMLLTLCGFTDEEIGELLGIALTTIRTERSKARRDIRRSYEKEELF